MAELKMLDGGILDSNREYLDAMQSVLADVAGMPGAINGYAIAVVFDDGSSNSFYVEDAERMIGLLEVLKHKITIQAIVAEDDDE